MRWALIGGLVVVAGCVSPEVAKQRGLLGWYRADVPPRNGRYHERFAEVAAADPNASCEQIQGQQFDPHRPIVVLIHGAGGEGPEMDAAVPRLVAWGPSSLYMFRWVPTEQRDAIAKRLARGLSRIAECVPDSRGRIIVIGHSAGGVIASYAAARIELPDQGDGAPWITIFTVGSMLAGNVPRDANADGSPQPNMMLDLGTHMTSYPAPARGVRVAHLRTQFPGDIAMTPIIGFVPNDPRIGVPGAPQIDLPRTLDHGGALQYVVSAVIDGRTGEWLNPAPAAAPVVQQARRDEAPSELPQVRIPTSGGSPLLGASAR